MATKTVPQLLSDDDLASMLKLVAEADSVELKLTVPDTERQATIAALGIDPLDAEMRQVFFFDTPDLALNDAGPRRSRPPGAAPARRLGREAPPGRPERAAGALPRPRRA